MGRPLIRKGTGHMRKKPLTETKGRIRFDIVDMEQGFLVKDIGHDEKGRFTTVAGLTFPEMIEDTDYRDLIDQIEQKCTEILETIKRERKTAGRSKK